MNLINIKKYDVSVVRILNMWQIILYKTNGLNEIETYVSKNEKDEYKVVYVFDRDKSQELFKKFRNHELEIGDFVLSMEEL